MVATTGHADQFVDDYRRAAELGLRTVRKSIGWRVCSPAGHRHIDFSRMRTAAVAAMDNGLQVLWSLMHYGMPPDVKVTDVDFADRFAEFAASAARELRKLTGSPSVYNPINEIGFLAWAMATRSVLGGDCSKRDGYLVKMKLVQASLRSMAAI